MKLNLIATTIATGMLFAGYAYAQFPGVPDAPAPTAPVVKAEPAKAEPAKPDAPVPPAALNAEVEKLKMDLAEANRQLTIERARTTPPELITLRVDKVRLEDEAKGLRGALKDANRALEYSNYGMVCWVVLAVVFFVLYLRNRPKKTSPPPANPPADQQNQQPQGQQQQNQQSQGQQQGAPRRSLFNWLRPLSVPVFAVVSFAAPVCHNNIPGVAIPLAVVGTSTFSCTGVSGTVVTIMGQNPANLAVFDVPIPVATGGVPASFKFTATSPTRARIFVDGREVSPLIVATPAQAYSINSSTDLAVLNHPVIPPPVTPASDPRVASLQAQVGALRLFISGLCDLDASGQQAAFGNGRGTSSPAGAACKDAIAKAAAATATEQVLADPRLTAAVGAGVTGGIEAYMKAHPPTPNAATADSELKTKVEGLEAAQKRIEEGHAILTTTVNGFDSRISTVTTDLSDTRGALAKDGSKELRKDLARGCSWADISNGRPGCGHTKAAAKKGGK